MACCYGENFLITAQGELLNIVSPAVMPRLSLISSTTATILDWAIFPLRRVVDCVVPLSDRSSARKRGLVRIDSWPVALVVRVPTEAGKYVQGI